MNNTNEEIQNEEENTIENLYRKYGGPPAWLNNVSQIISSTDTSISGTVDVYKTIVEDLNDQLLALNPTEQKIKNIMNSLSALGDKMKELESQKDSLQKVDKFIRENLEFIMIAVEANGKIKGIDGRLESLEKRTGHIEDKINISKQNSIAIWAIIISIAGILVSVIVAFFT